MGNVTLNEQHLKDIAFAIREKCGLSHGNPIMKISKSPNVTDKETYTSYANYLDVIDTVTIPGASSIRVVMDVQTEATNYDWVQIAIGTVTSTSSFTGNKYGGTTKTTQTLTFKNTDTISFRFRSDSSNGNYYGYWAEVTGLDANGNVITDGIPEVAYRPCDMAAAIAAIEVPEGEQESIFGASLENVEVTATITGGISNASQIDVDLSPYIGTNDVEPFLLTFDGGTNSQALTDVGIFYNGSTFSEIFGASAYSGYGAASAVSPEKCSISKGIVTIKLSRNLILSGSAVDILYMKNNGSIAHEDMLLSGINVESFTNDRITALRDYVFSETTALKKVYFPNVETIGKSAFYMSKITEAVFPKATQISDNSFRYCSSLQVLDIGAPATFIGACLSNANSVNLILRGSTMSTAASTSVLSSSGFNGKIYVPSALIEQYKADATWSKWASSFYAIEGSDYE